MSKISVADRIKEISYSVGTGDFVLSGAAQGFSSFASSFNYGDIVYYAIIDGVNYEIGSGEYLFSSPNSIIRRYPFKSTNNDNLINFPAGTKQVYVTYPGQKAVLTASDFGSFSSPQASGIAFWGSEQILDYDLALVWDATNNRLGINKSSPVYAIDIGGPTAQSLVRFGGVILGASGIVFPQGTYSGGQQQEPFLRNVLDISSGADAVFSLSGLVSERINLKKQVASTVFIGPPSASPPGYPSFRALLIDDIPDLSTLYVRETGVGADGQLAFYKDQRVVGYDSRLIWDDTNNYLGVNNPNPTQSLDVVGNAILTGGLIVNSGITFPSGTPSVITDKLYNVGNQLYFNGSPIGAGGGGGGSPWTIADGIGNSETIAGSTVYFSGGPGVSVSYNTTSNVVSISGTTTPEVFNQDLTVSLTAPKTFGKYANGQVIPASGKTASEIIRMAIVEALAATTTLTSSTTIAFNQSGINNFINFSHIINSLGATVVSASAEWRRNNTGPWTVLTSTMVTPSSHLHSLTDSAFNTQPFNYRYTVNDSVGGSGQSTLNITPAAYVAPSITSFTAGTTARDLGDISGVFGGTITRNSVNVALSGYYIQRSVNAGAYSNLGSFIPIHPSSGTWPVSGSDGTAGINSTSVAYRVQPYDIYQQPANTSSVVTINLTHRSFLGYSTNTVLTLSQILALANSTLTNSKVRTVTGVTSGAGNYTYYAYAASAGDLAGIIQDGAAPVLGAFTKLSDVTGTNSFGATVTYRVYRSNATNAFTGNSLAFS